MTASAASNINRLWADLLVDELIRNGIHCFCLAPGSRSTPLVTAIAAHPDARPVVHYDERGTAFFALGYGRATRRPAAWITTSGTALANGFPAVIEAATDGVPLLLVTADRPPELRHTGANQTIDQVKLYGDYVRWFFDLPTPTTDIDPAMVLTTVDHAVYRAVRAPQGPVHINCMFREPLAPTPDGNDYQPYTAHLAAWQEHRQPYTHYAASQPATRNDVIERLGELLHGVEKGVVVAGKLDTTRQGQAVVRLAGRLGWPLLPDIGSHLRLGEGKRSAQVMPYYDQILGSPVFSGIHTPDAVLHVGGRLVSKQLVQWLARCRPQPYVVVNNNAARLDPGHHATHRIESGVITFCDALAEVMPPAAPEPSRWLASWRDASYQADRVLADHFAGAQTLSEPLVARLLSEALPDGHGVVLSNSMPVRDVDRFAVPDGAGAPVALNRGASGIDGLVATAAGFAEGLRAPVTLLTGDLALLHDLNALALVRERPVVIVVLNNNGGGIFHFLPIADYAEVFEPFFGTPHGLTFDAAAAQFGLAYHHPQTPRDFLDVYRTACARPGGTLIEVTTDRKANVTLHQHLLARIDEAIGA